AMVNGGRSLYVVAILQLLGCGSSSTPPCQGQCLNEGLAKECILVDGCNDDADCPTGTRCGVDPEYVGDVTTTTPRGCYVVRGVALINENELTSKFDVDSFDLEAVRS